MDGKKCDRCGTEVMEYTMSWFNTDEICFPCDYLETQHPDFEFAKVVESAYVKLGEYNYPGIGYPGENKRVSRELKAHLIKLLKLEWHEK